MPKILIILPFFGKFDSLFPFWLQSCSFNKAINFLIVTNDQTPYKYTSNITVIYTSFEKLRSQIQSMYNFQISLNSPYRLCCFKPAYGDIFKDFIEGYDFWGYCDCDMLFGDIEHFLPNDLDRYDKIGTYGHFSLIKNTEENNLLYQYNNAYKIAFSIDRPLFFDEAGFPLILEKYNKKTYDLRILDFQPRLKNLSVLNDHIKTAKHVFSYNKGHVQRHYIDATTKDNIMYEEYAYIHFLKRPLKIKCKKVCTQFLIVPNQIIPMLSITSNLIKKHTKNGIFLEYWKNSFRLKNFIDRLFNRLYRNKKDKKYIQKINEKICN